MSNNTGKLELFIGPMFSGKSTELIKNVRLHQVLNRNVLVLKPKIDDRYDNNRIVTHSGEKEDCSISIDDLQNISIEIIQKYDIIVIDEGQFFKSLKECCLTWVEKYDKHVIVGGLDGDFLRKPIGEILDLIPYADSYKKLCALCKICNDGTLALFSKRIINNKDEQVLIGGAESYISVCRKHYLT
jgi:thymidine kinase